MFKITTYRTVLMSLFLVGGMGGCANYDEMKGLFRVDPVVHRTQQESDKAKDFPDYFETINLDVYMFNPPHGINLKPAYELALTDATARDRLQSEIMTLSDKVCEQHKGDITANNALMNSAFGILTSALAGSAAIVSGTVAQGLAGGATFTNSTRSVIGEEIYQKYIAPAIVKAIEEKRIEKRSEIMAKNGKTTAEYRVWDAINDAQNYHQRCSFYSGVKSLAEAAEKVGLDRAGIDAEISRLRDELVKLQTALSGVSAANVQAQQNLNDSIREVTAQINDLTLRRRVLRK